MSAATHLQVMVVTPVAKHPADDSPCFVQEEDLSGVYQKLNGRTLYSPERGVFIDLDRATMAAAMRGQPLRVGRRDVS